MGGWIYQGEDNNIKSAPCVRPWSGEDGIASHTRKDVSSDRGATAGKLRGKSSLSSCWSEPGEDACNLSRVPARCEAATRTAAHSQGGRLADLGSHIPLLLLLLLLLIS